MELKHEVDRIYAESSEGKLLCEITFPLVRDGVRQINRTFVDDSLRGQGMASKLVEAAARQLADEKVKAAVTCSYAKEWFARHPEYASLLSD